MGVYLNPGKRLFEQCYRSRIYVDKSMLISNLNQVLGTEQRYVFVSRPRRFGKSMHAKMLAAYYDKSCDSRELFDHLQIAADSSYKTHLNKYDVFFLTMTDFLPEHPGESFVEAMKQAILLELKKAYGMIPAMPEQKLWQILGELYHTQGISFVFIIDEWDCIFREQRHNTEVQNAYLSFLRSLLKDKPYVELVYMTGILPIKKYVSDSTLNMFQEFTMTDQGPFRAFAGFTEEDVRQLCKVHQMDYNVVKHWYNGYHTGGLSLYNPKSVVSAMESGKTKNYWTETGAYESVQEYINLNFDGLKDAVIAMLAGGAQKVNVRSFRNDLISFSDKDDVLTLLVHLGYLTYDEELEQVSIPNEEIWEELYRAVEKSNWDTVVRAIQASQALLEATWRMDEAAVARGMDQAHEDYASMLTYNNETALSCAVSMAYYSAKNEYMIYRELPAGKGFADMVFVPKKSSDKPAMVVELKWNQSAETAIQQIKEKGYCRGLEQYSGNILLVGISYQRESKLHECVIEEIKQA